jgi:hypothetical protein
LRIKEFISLAEATLNRNEAIRDERFETAFTLDQEIVSLPNDFREPLSLTFDDDVRFGPIEFVPPEMLPGKKAQLGLSDFPRFASIVDDGTKLRLAPVPDRAYLTNLNYITKLVSLSADTGETVNWLLSSHPDVYLYATLVESAPYLKDDERMPLWKQELADRLEELRRLKERQRLGGNAPRIRPRRAIG